MFGETRRPGDGTWEVLALLALLALVFVPALFSHEPWHFDELRYLEVARQMGEYGDWFVPHINGEVYREKPPVFFWFVASVQLVTGGDWNVAGLLMVALSVSACAFLVRHMGGLLFDDLRLGTLGAALLVTSTFVIDKSTRALLDPFFMFLTLASTLGLLYAAVGENRKARLLGAFAGILFMTLACMTKGPVGIIVSLLSAGALGLVWKGRKGVCIAALVAALVISGGLTLLYIYAVAQQVGMWYWERMVFKQTTGRAVDAWMHGKQWWMYLANMPRMLFPWIAILPAAAWGIWRARKKPGGRAGLGLAAAFLVCLVFFSSVSGKRMGYLMPLFPISSLAIAWGVRQLADASPGAWRTFLWRLPLLLMGLLPFAGVLVALAFVVGPFIDVSSFIDDKTALRFMEELPRIAPFAGAIVALGLLALGVMLWTTEPRWRARLAAAVCTIAVLTALAHLAVYPALDWRNSVEPLSVELQQIKPPGDKLVFLNDHKDGRLNYYLQTEHHDVYRADDIAREVDQPGRLWVFALKDQWNEDIPEELKQRFELKISNKYAGSKTHVYAEKQPAP